ncbi:phosphatidyl synthase [Phaffia rhodozyma]|uniref:Phosphatidyl synthase n=1 Tax=Phaffia rhodozyma TaxID=264483 RepID=A0A0F7SQH4_PHARH|nr:phosphatidyl synthase [Phaffia rhodozyma]
MLLLLRSKPFSYPKKSFLQPTLSNVFPPRSSQCSPTISHVVRSARPFSISRYTRLEDKETRSSPPSLESLKITPPGPLGGPTDPASAPDTSTISSRTLSENIYTIPNFLTVSRILSCPMLGYFIIHGDFVMATTLLGFAGATDLADGYIARKWHMGSVLGTILDPAADKTLMTTLVVSLTYKGLLPLPLAAIVLGRDVLLSFAAFYLRYITLPKPRTWSRYWNLAQPTVEVHPTQISKYNTFLQLLLMGSTTISPLLVAYGNVDLFLIPLQYIVGTTTIISGLSYLWTKGAVVVLKR